MSANSHASPAATDPLKAALQQVRRSLWLLLGFGLVINMLFLVTPLYLIQVFDRVLASQRVETLLALSLIAGFALLIMGVLEAVRGRLLTSIGVWLEAYLGEDFVAGGLHAAARGRPASAQALRDLSTLRGFILGPLKAFLDLPWMPIFLAALWLLHPVLGLIAAGAAATLVALALLNQAVSAGKAQQANSGRVAIEGLMEQAGRSADALVSMGMVTRFLDRWRAAQAQVLAQTRRVGNDNALFTGATRFGRMLAQTAVLGVGAYFVIAGDLTAGTIVAASILMSRALAPLEQSVGGWKAMVTTRNALARLKGFATAAPGRRERMPLPEPQGRLTCHNLWFQPRPDWEPTLKGVELTVEPGEVMAVIGPSGAGKSTLCRIMVGTWRPDSGHVRLDAADIHDEWPAEQLGRHVGYIAQEIEFLPATVRENIARLTADADPETVVAAATAAGVHETILSLPQGYDTPIGAGGLPLSAGQRQRIALARALYGRPRLIVLDEPNSNLDGAGEEALALAIRAEAAWGSAVVLVTHSVRLLVLVHRIAVLRDGRVEFCAEREEALRRLRQGNAEVRRLNASRRPIAATRRKPSDQLGHADALEP